MILAAFILAAVTLFIVAVLARWPLAQDPHYGFLGWIPYTLLAIAIMLLAWPGTPCAK